MYIFSSIPAGFKTFVRPHDWKLLFCSPARSATTILPLARVEEIDVGNLAACEEEFRVPGREMREEEDDEEEDEEEEARNQRIGGGGE